MYLVDGGYNNDPQNNTGNAMPFPDALQEFSVESGVRSARFGMSTGATVNAVTKSGTNTFHGSVFDFVRDHTLQRHPLLRADGERRPRPRRRAEAEPVGGTFGGPLIKDKLFFFGGMQITNTRIAPLAADQIVPTEEVRRGDFRRIMSAACRGGTARTLGAPFVNNQIDPALFHPDLAEDHEHAAAARSGARSGRLRPLRAADPERQRRAAVHRPRRLPDDAATSASSAAYFYTKYLHAPRLRPGPIRTC